jgi:hypothetical protein
MNSPRGAVRLACCLDMVSTEGSKNPTPHRGLFTVNAPLRGVGKTKPKPNLVTSNPQQGSIKARGCLWPTPARHAFTVNCRLRGVPSTQPPTRMVLACSPGCRDESTNRPPTPRFRVIRPTGGSEPSGR